MKKKYAPIALFTYNRLQHTMQTVDALKANTLASETNLFIFSDGAKNEEDKSKVEEMRTYLKAITGFQSVTLFENTQNKGLAPSLIAGINQIFKSHDRIIVFEDDIVCSPLALEFLNDGLEIYKDDEKVGMVSGFIEKIKYLPDLFFDYKICCWGWATWKRAWEEVNFDGAFLLNELVQQGKAKKFDLDGAFPYVEMLKKQIAGKNSSWAVRVYASFFLKNMLTLYPGKSYTKHIGFDGGTHCSGLGKSTELDGETEAVENVAKPIPVEVNPEALQKIKRFFYKRRKYSLFFFKKELQRRWIRVKHS